MILSQPESNHDDAPVVMLHASASNRRQWTSLTEDLSDRFEAIALDLPGYAPGGAKRLGEIDGMASTAIPMVAEILKIGEPCHLVGHSFGGAVALKIALMRPDLVKSLTVYEPAAFSLLRWGSDSDRALFGELQAVGRALSIASRIGHPEIGMKSFIDFWSGNGAWMQLPEKARENLSNVARIVAGDFQNVHAERWNPAQLAAVEIPTLIMSGLDSPDIAQRTAVRLSNVMPAAQLALLPSLGHMAPMTDPSWVNPRICEHIARVVRSTERCVWPTHVAA